MKDRNHFINGQTAQQWLLDSTSGDARNVLNYLQCLYEFTRIYKCSDRFWIMVSCVSNICLASRCKCLVNYLSIAIIVHQGGFADVVNLYFIVICPILTILQIFRSFVVHNKTFRVSPIFFSLSRHLCRSNCYC